MAIIERGTIDGTYRIYGATLDTRQCFRFPYFGDDDDGWCFIATATYGSGMAGEVQILRKFRDNFLMNSAPVRSFVRFYYRVSPPVADFIGRHESLRLATCWSLMPLVGVSWLTMQIGPVATLVLVALLVAMTITGVAWLLRRRRLQGTMA